MSRQVVSQFNEKPRLRVTWWAMGLGLVTLFIGPLLGISAAVIVPWVTSLSGGTSGAAVGFTLGLLALLLTIAALITGWNSLHKGERSWALWLGFVPALLAVAFWVFMIIGEFAFPH